jgi:enoyl-CoA hydratase/carnithine racemase
VSAPVRHEHEHELAVATIDSPPLNLFDQPLWESLDSVISEAPAARASS